MPKWDYALDTVRDQDDERAEALLAERLVEWGSEGWELVTVLHSAEQPFGRPMYTYRMILKRPKS